MSDIDFDELDRAVASVMTEPGDNKTEPEASKSEETEAPTDEPIAKAPAKSAQDLHPVSQKPVQRGRFLDMVHPAHDMAPRGSGVPIGPAPARTGVPSIPSATNQTFVSDVVAARGSGVPSVETTPEPTPEPVPAQKPEPTPSEVEKDSVHNDPVDFFANDATASEADKSDDAAPSPFIADAKVEKRPLGAFSAGSVVSPSLPVGEELQSQLIKVESEANVINTAQPFVPTKFAPETSTVTPNLTTESSAPVESSDIALETPAPSVYPALGSDSAEPNNDDSKKSDEKPDDLGLFKQDTSTDFGLQTNPASDKRPKISKGTIIWITVAVAVILIGFGVGATLYFVVLQ